MSEWSRDDFSTAFHKTKLLLRTHRFTELNFEALLVCELQARGVPVQRQFQVFKDFHTSLGTKTIELGRIDLLLGEQINVKPVELKMNCADDYGMPKQAAVDQLLSYVHELGLDHGWIVSIESSRLWVIDGGGHLNSTFRLGPTSVQV